MTTAASFFELWTIKLGQINFPLFFQLLFESTLFCSVLINGPQLNITLNLVDVFFKILTRLFSHFFLLLHLTILILVNLIFLVWFYHDLIRSAYHSRAAKKGRFGIELM